MEILKATRAHNPLRRRQSQYIFIPRDFYQLITKGQCKPRGGHVSYPTDNPTATGQELRVSLWVRVEHLPHPITLPPTTLTSASCVRAPRLWTFPHYPPQHRPASHLVRSQPAHRLWQPTIRNYGSYFMTAALQTNCLGWRPTTDMVFFLSVA